MPRDTAISDVVLYVNATVNIDDLSEDMYISVLDSVIGSISNVTIIGVVNINVQIDIDEVDKHIYFSTTGIG